LKDFIKSSHKPVAMSIIVERREPLWSSRNTNGYQTGFL